MATTHPPCDVLPVPPVALYNSPLSEYFFLIDARSPEAFAGSHVVTAWNLPPSPTLAEDAARLHGHVWDTNPPEVSNRAYVYGGEDDEATQLVAKAVAGLPRMRTVYVVTGGFSRFHALFPALCDAGLDLEGTPPLPACVLPQLFLGSVSSARDRRVFDMLHITHVVNLATELPNFFEGEATYHKEALVDDDSQDIRAVLDPVLGFMRDALKDPAAKLLVHCHQGKSRSSALVMAYLLAEARSNPASTLPATVDDALAYVRSCRPYARPNAGFMEQLRAAFP